MLLMDVDILVLISKTFMCRLYLKRSYSKIIYFRDGILAERAKLSASSITSNTLQTSLGNNKGHGDLSIANFIQKIGGRGVLLFF